ncbi:MAG: hypothetical protein ABH840_01650 [Nanoarchaeota archaeon]
MPVPKARDRIKHFKKVQKYQDIFGKHEKKEEPTVEEKKAKEDKILAILGMRKSENEEKSE